MYNKNRGCGLKIKICVHFWVCKQSKNLLSLLHDVPSILWIFFHYFPDVTNGSHMGLSCSPQSRLDESGVRLIS